MSNNKKPISLFKVISLFKNTLNSEYDKNLTDFINKNDKFMKAFNSIPSKKTNLVDHKKAMDKLKNKNGDDLDKYLTIKKSHLRLSGDSISDIKTIIMYIIENIIKYAKDNVDTSTQKKNYRVVVEPFRNDKFKDEKVYSLIKNLPSVRNLLSSNEPLTLYENANFKPVVNGVFKRNTPTKDLQCTDELKKFISNVIYDFIIHMVASTLIVKKLDPKCRTVNSKHIRVIMDLIQLNESQSLDLWN